jgi:hypothetical protein
VKVFLHVFSARAAAFRPGQNCLPVLTLAWLLADMPFKLLCLQLLLPLLLAALPAVQQHPPPPLHV